MSKEFVTIVGASGHIGRAAAEILLAKGHKVLAVARDLDRLKDLADKGAEIRSTDVSDPNDTASAFVGARAAFVLIPPNPTAIDIRAEQNAMADSLVAAIKASEITHIVALSSIGAHQGTQMGPVNGLFDWEKKLRTLSGVNILILRPSYFMENLLVNLGMIRDAKMMGTALRADVRFPAIATQDIAAAVAEALANPTFSGVTVRELHGQRDITMEEARSAIAKATGIPDLKYVQFPYTDAEKAMVGMGLSADYARLLIEMTRSMNDGIMKPSQSRTTASTTPTSIEQFAGIFDTLLKAPPAPAKAGR